jgi:cation diffusion facilitator CzcD-associated flavoprotein CzcO
MFEQNTAFISNDPIATVLADTALEYLTRKVEDPELREKLTPTHPFGCTRTLISSNYYPALQRENVHLVNSGVEAITATGIRSTDGTERPADAIVLCTGFHAADYLRGVEVVGSGGRELHEHWNGLPRAYHGIAVPGFPNFFMMYGPNTNQGGNSILLMLEAQAEFIARALEATGESGAAWLDVTPEAMAQHESELKADLSETIWEGGCSTYFHSAAGEVVTQLPHTSSWYAKATEQIDRGHFTFGGHLTFGGMG